MRIAHVTCLYPPEHLGGAPQQCESIALAQLAEGHQVSVFSGLLDPGGAMYEHRTRDQDGVHLSLLNTVDAFDERAHRNYRHQEVDPFFERFLKQRRPEVVHFHSIQSLGGNLLPLARRAGARVVVTMHDLWWICARQFCVDRTWHPCIPAVTPGSCHCQTGSEDLWKRNDYLKSCLESCDLILSPSSALLDRIRWSGVRGRMEVAPNGVRKEIVHAERPPHQGPPRLLFIGGSNHMKGLQVLVPALRDLHQRGLRYQADVYGVDPFAIRTASSLRGLPVRSHKSFEPAELDSILAAADLLVLPSVMFESSSRAVREALLRGVPVVATETGGPEEVIEDGVNGLLVPPDDAEALAGALAKAVEPGALEKLRGQGPRGAIPTPQEEARRLLGLYREAPVPGPPPPQPPGHVLFLAGIEGAPLRYRVHDPIEQLGLRGVTSTLRHYADPRAQADLERAGAVVIYRSPATVELLALIAAARRRGLPVVFSVDDLIFDAELAEELPSLGGLSPDAKRLWIDGVRRYRATLEACGRGIGSTPEIVRRMEEIGIDARCHPNGVGTPLAVASEGPRRARRRNPAAFRVGYFSGTDTHDVDLDHVAEALARFQAGHPEVELVLGGHLKPHPKLERITRLPFAPWHLHPARLAGLDLNLAPLIPNAFNDAKSSIKWSEAALVEVPTLASASEPFRASIEHGETGLLAEDPGRFYEALEEAFGDRERLERIGRKARLAAYQRGNPWTLGDQLLETLAHFGAESHLPPRPRAEVGARAPGGGANQWPSERRLTALEPAGLYPGLTASGERAAPGNLPRSFAIPAEAGPLKRLDVQVATYGRTPEVPLKLTLTDSAGSHRRTLEAPPEDLGDNGWAAFELDTGLEGGSTASISAAPGAHLSVWETPEGTVARSFHLPPVPPHFPIAINRHQVATPRPSDRLRTLGGFAGLVGRQAVYILRTEGATRGARRIAGAVRRRLIDRMLTRRR